MWLVYLLALVFGGGLLFVQAVSGGHEGAVSGHAPDVQHHGAGPGLLSIRSAIYRHSAWPWPARSRPR
ncbi:MAG: hypothetical protein DMF78_18120 [Acidobacteria bacterium]|nr:MAG: hypothetical protein DMF78_18120 [Acidobacteriota bacterium]